MEKTFKKLLALLTSVLVVAGVYSCNKDDDDPNPTKVVLKSISDVNDFGFTVNAEVSGDFEIEERGIYYSKSSISKDLTSDKKEVLAKEAGKGFYTVKVENALTGTQFYVRAFAKDKKGKITVSDEQTVTTLEHEGTSVAFSSTDATDHKITVKCVVAGNDQVVSSGVYFSDKAIDKDKLGDLKPVTAKEGGNGEFEYSFSKLFRGTEYHMLAFAKNNDGSVFYSKDEVVKTTAKDEASIKITVENGDKEVSAKIVSNDPLESVELVIKDDITKKPADKKDDAKDGEYIYTVKFSGMDEGEYTIAASTKGGAKAEEKACFGRFSHDYSLKSIVIEYPNTYEYKYGNTFGTVQFYAEGGTGLDLMVKSESLDLLVIVGKNEYVTANGDRVTEKPEDFLFQLNMEKADKGGYIYTLVGSDKLTFLKK